MQDVLFEIALRSKIRTIISILCVFPKLDMVHFWKSKCLKDYPSKHYLDCWTGRENYLMGNKLFCINMNTQYPSPHYLADKYVFEYTSLLRNIQHRNTDRINNVDYLELFTFTNIKPYILIAWNDDLCQKGTFNTEYECFEQLKQYQLKGEYVNAALFNLSHMSPYFIKYDILIQREGSYVQFYKCYKDYIALLYSK